jgi:hypothetical protein
VTSLPAGLRERSRSVAEMLVRLVDKNNHDDPVKHAQLHKRRDVVVIQEDGQYWGPVQRGVEQQIFIDGRRVPNPSPLVWAVAKMDRFPGVPQIVEIPLANPQWTIVEVPGVPVADLSAFLAEVAHDEANPHHLRQRRAFAFDVDKHDGKPLTREAALAMKLAKPPMPDPNVL